ncbi:MAG: hypothetical protein L3K19_04775, partial [Thermoplasmata archaeon]|nr:hypothetical protein [Thermoplasmata archaeon]
GIPCAVGRTALAYRSEVVQVPASPPNGALVQNTSFLGCYFRAWIELHTPFGAYIQGTATEPSGLELAFEVWENNSSFGGNPKPTNDTVQTWFSPDGEVGVEWLSEVRGSSLVRLSVAQPLPTYLTSSFALTLEQASAGTPEYTYFDGMHFTVQSEGWDSRDGMGMSVVVTEPNGTVVQLGAGVGPVFNACSLLGDIPSSILQNATCTENFAADLSVGMVYDGYLGVTLMVRDT